MTMYRVKLLKYVQEAADTFTYFFEKPADLTWEEGSHTHIAMLGFDAGSMPDRDLVRHMSLATLPQENSLGITTRIPREPSTFKTMLSEMKVGDEAIIFKIGSKLALRRKDRPLVFLSMGVGIAAFRPVILAYTGNPDHIPQLINVNVDSSGTFIFKEELEALESPTYHNYWHSSRLEFYAGLKDLAQELSDAIYYVVGSDFFIKDVIAALRAEQVGDQDIIIDKKDILLPFFFEKL